MSTVERRPSRFDYSRVTVTFDSAGDACEGWLYRPDRPTRPPVVVMAGGLALPRETLRPVAERFAANGVAAFCFDYRGVGGSEGHPRNLLSPARAVEDWQEATARVRDVAGVDGRRVALWGHSLGAAGALTVAAEDPRVRGVVAVAPVRSGATLFGGRSVPARLKALLAGARDRVQSLVTDPHTVPVVGGDGETALVADTAFRGSYRSRHPDGVVDVPARSLLALSRFGVDLDGIRCPTLFVGGTRDAVVPVDDVEFAAEDVSDSTTLLLPAGHLDVLDDPAAMAHQLAFLDTSVF